MHELAEDPRYQARIDAVASFRWVEVILHTEAGPQTYRGTFPSPAAAAAVAAYPALVLHEIACGRLHLVS